MAFVYAGVAEHRGFWDEHVNPAVEARKRRDLKLGNLRTGVSAVC